MKYATSEFSSLKQRTLVFSHSFCEPGIQEQLSWVFSSGCLWSYSSLRLNWDWEAYSKMVHPHGMVGSFKSSPCGLLHRLLKCCNSTAAGFPQSGRKIRCPLWPGVRSYIPTFLLYSVLLGVNLKSNLLKKEIRPHLLKGRVSKSVRHIFKLPHMCHVHKLPIDEYLALGWPDS